MQSFRKLIKNYYYRCLFRYFSIYIRPNNSVVEINPSTDISVYFFEQVRFLFIGRDIPDFISRDRICSMDEVRRMPPDYFIMNGNIQHESNIQKLLLELHSCCSAQSRIIVTYYSSLWRPFIYFATVLGLRDKTMEQNWISHDDMANFLLLADFEPVLSNNRILCPVYIPVISTFLNRYCALMPFFRLFCIVGMLMFRPLGMRQEKALSVSVVVPARNEAGNIENLVRRLPMMGPDDELIFVEGHSNDNTWDRIVEVQRKFFANRQIKIIKQPGKGKGDAVRKGFESASKDILMILDADLSVTPESLPLFYHAMMRDKGEFLNGSRLVYPMDNKAMRFINMVGNKFFALAFSYVLGQKFKDTLCGTKVISKDNYRKIARNRSFFGEFDPFGDFDLIFGASRLGLKVVEIPVTYRERSYGKTNIRRWKHGYMLLKMLIYSARKIKFV